MLHVEDDADILKVVAAMLANSVRVSSARSLRVAREQLAKAHFDLVILDVAMPDGHGLDLLPLINAKQPSVPVVVFSAHEIGRDMAEKVAAVLVKSRHSNEQLLRTIESMLDRG